MGITSHLVSLHAFSAHSKFKRLRVCVGAACFFFLSSMRILNWNRTLNVKPQTSKLTMREIRTPSPPLVCGFIFKPNLSIDLNHNSTQHFRGQFFDHCNSSCLCALVLSACLCAWQFPFLPHCLAVFPVDEQEPWLCFVRGRRRFHDTHSDSLHSQSSSLPQIHLGDSGPILTDHFLETCVQLFQRLCRELFSPARRYWMKETSVSSFQSFVQIFLRPGSKRNSADWLVDIENTERQTLFHRNRRLNTSIFGRILEKWTELILRVSNEPGGFRRTVLRRDKALEQNVWTKKKCSLLHFSTCSNFHWWCVE